MRVFVIRPFGVKEGIDFDRVDAELIQPALARLSTPDNPFAGGTTGLISRQGNIREDMFRMIVASDLVIADVSIHNANAFYELGIRHALRPRHTFLLRCRTEHAYPFDLQTDRYFLYEAGDPGAAVGPLVEALRVTVAWNGSDSPVFSLLPSLKPHRRGDLVELPFDFREDVNDAIARGARGDLRLLAHEATTFAWDQEGLRLVGGGQLKLHAFAGARDTFEALRSTAPHDVHANLKLATVFQRLALAGAPEQKVQYLTRSDQAIERVLAGAPGADIRAEACCLQASNEKSRWMADFLGLDGADLLAAALRSPHFERMLTLYLKAANLDLNAHYPAANALGLLKTQLSLAARAPDVWRDLWDDEDPPARLRELEQLAQRLTASLCLVLGLDEVMGRREGPPDPLAASSKADFVLITSPERTQRVVAGYRKALADADRFNLEATRRNLAIYQRLGVFEPGVGAAIGVTDALIATKDGTANPPTRVVLFAGHMVDAPDRPTAKRRFPRTPEAEAKARALIRDAVAGEIEGHEGTFLGIAGAACGSDILFHEVCAELGAKSDVYLLVPQERFQVTSVQHGGADWVDRYRRLLATSAPRVLQPSLELPRWLVDKSDYDAWQRNNFWMMFNALATGARDLTFIALYNRDLEPNGPGGTRHLVAEAARWGFKPIELEARILLEA